MTENTQAPQISDDVIDKYIENGEKIAFAYRNLQDPKLYPIYTRRGREAMYLKRLRRYITQIEGTVDIRALREFEKDLRVMNERKLADDIARLLVVLYARGVFEPLVPQLLMDDKHDWKLWNSMVLRSGGKYETTKWVDNFHKAVLQTLRAPAAHDESEKIFDMLSKKQNKNRIGPFHFARRIKGLKDIWIRRQNNVIKDIMDREKSIEHSRQKTLRRLTRKINNELELNYAATTLNWASAESTAEIEDIDNRIRELAAWLETTLMGLYKLANAWLTGQKPIMHEDLAKFVEYYDLSIRYLNEQYQLLEEHEKRKQDIGMLIEQTRYNFEAIMDHVREDKQLSELEIPQQQDWSKAV